MMADADKFPFRTILSSPEFNVCTENIVYSKLFSWTLSAAHRSDTKYQQIIKCLLTVRITQLHLLQTCGHYQLYRRKAWGSTSQVSEKAPWHHLERQGQEWGNSEAYKVKEVGRSDHKTNSKMAGACVTDVRDKNSSPSYLLGVWEIRKRPGRPRKSCLNTINHDTQDIKLTWQEAERLAAHKTKWHQLAAQCVFDADWTKVKNLRL